MSSPTVSDQDALRWNEYSILISRLTDTDLDAIGSDVDPFCALASALSILLIPRDAIDNNLARGLHDKRKGSDGAEPDLPAVLQALAHASHHHHARRVDPGQRRIAHNRRTDLIAAWLSHAASALPPMGSLALLLAAAMAVTPFLNNAATVLVMAPIAANFAGRFGYNPDPFLMAVAIGAACDFLTPIGHQCNTLVMGPGGYRFSDYWRLGLPLSLIVLLVGVPLIAFFWPF